MVTVMLGAFGAHALKPLVSEKMIDVFQTGIQYQMFHAPALLIIGILMKQWQVPELAEQTQKYLRLSSSLFLLGILLFCGSLYALALSEAINGEGIRWLGAITPFGGLALIAAWFYLFLALRKLS